MESQPEHHFEPAEVHEIKPHPYIGLPPGTLKLLLAMQLLAPDAEVIDLNRNIVDLAEYRDGNQAA